MSFAPVKINAQKLNSRHSEVDFQRFIGLRRSPGHPVVIINSVEVNILIGGRKMKESIIRSTVAAGWVVTFFCIIAAGVGLSMLSSSRGQGLLATLSLFFCAAVALSLCALGAALLLNRKKPGSISGIWISAASLHAGLGLAFGMSMFAAFLQWSVGIW